MQAWHGILHAKLKEQQLMQHETMSQDILSSDMPTASMRFPFSALKRVQLVVFGSIGLCISTCSGRRHCRTSAPPQWRLRAQQHTC